MSCVDEVVKAFPGLSSKQAERLEKTFKTILKENETNTERAMAMSKKAVSEAEKQAVDEVLTKVDMTQKKMRNLEHITQAGFQGNISEGLLSLIEGTTRKVGNKFDTAVRFHDGYRAKLIGAFNNDLDHKGIRTLFASGSYDEKIIVELYGRADVNYKSKMPDEVKQMADSVERLNKSIVNLQRDNGSTIKYREGYVFQQTHNPDAILDDVDTWVTDIMELMDHDKSFGGLKSPKHAEKTLRELSGKIGDIGLGPKSFMGASREIVFKDGESFFKYNQKYGYNNLYAGLSASIEEGTRKAALNAKFGNDPRRGIDSLLAQVKKVHGISQDHSSMDAFKKSVEGFSGSGKRYDNFDSIYAKSFRGIQLKKKVDVFRLLGMTGFTSMMDAATTMMTLRTVDGSTISNFVNVPINWMESALPIGTSRKEMAELLQISLEDTTREMAELGTGSYQPGIMAKAMDGWMTVNLTKPITNINRATAMRLHAKSLTDNITSTGKLNDFQLNTRKAIGLTDEDVSNLSNIKKTLGETYVNPRMLEENIEGFDRAYLDGLQSKLSSFFNDQVRSASPVRGLKEERQLGLTRSKDDPVRLAAELGTQFKGTVLKSGHVFAEMMRASNSTGNLSSTEWNSMVSLAQGIFAATLVGTTVNRLKDYVRGKETEITPSWVVKSMIDSGAAGMYVDLALEVFSRDGMSRGISPLIQTVDDVVGFINNEVGIAEGTRSGRNDFLERSWKLMAKQTLPQNLWLLEVLNAHILKEAITFHKGEF